MKQSFILSKKNYGGEFYHSGPYGICSGFVWNFFGLDCPYIKATITNKRPHQSRWKRVTRAESYSYLSVGDLTFTPLPEHLDFLHKYGGVLWIKISPAKKEDFDKYTARTEEHGEFRDI
jgi:hypothetical protein